jgi:peptidoglycan hydrolase-like protein with peptidoglycan-binding domain
MKKLVIGAVAATFLLAPGATSTVLLAQPSPGSQARAAGDVNMDATPSLSPDIIRRVQLALQKKGINPGPVDGIFGPLTKEAVRSFQDRYGIKASGDIDNQTLFALGEVDLAI